MTGKSKPFSHTNYTLLGSFLATAGMPKAAGETAGMA
jgi:hypothetical protein